MKQEKMELNAAVSNGLALPWAFIQELSRVTMGQTPDSVNTEELLEASFFSPTEEIRIWREDNALHAARISDETNDKTVIKQYYIDNSAFGHVIETKRYIDFDEDGQAYYAASRLCGWKGAAENE